MALQFCDSEVDFMEMAVWLEYFDWQALQWRSLGFLDWRLGSGVRGLGTGGQMHVRSYLGINCRRVFTIHRIKEHDDRTTFSWSLPQCY